MQGLHIIPHWLTNRIINSRYIAISIQKEQKYNRLAINYILHLVLDGNFLKLVSIILMAMFL